MLAFGRTLIYVVEIEIEIELHTLRLIARQPWRHCVTSLRSADWLATV